MEGDALPTKAIMVLDEDFCCLAELEGTSRGPEVRLHITGTPLS